MASFMGAGRARALGFAILGVAFLVGGMAGAAVDRVLTAETVWREAPQAEEPRRHVIDEVEMTGDQRGRIDAILERRSERMKAAWAEISPRLEAITDSARAEIMQVLTPEQRADYELRLEQRRLERERQEEATQ